VASVAIYTRRDPKDIRTIAMDTSSRTSVALATVLLRRLYDTDAKPVAMAPDLETMLAQYDAALVIGDPALLVDHRAMGAGDVEKIDLGQVWTEMTGLPFVWAFWAGRADALLPAAVKRLQAAKDAGVRISDALADAYVGATPQHRDLARRYLRENIRFDLTRRMLEGLRTYYREAAGLGVIASAPEPLFFAD
jgi:predicted solute-binding protein